MHWVPPTDSVTSAPASASASPASQASTVSAASSTTSASGPKAANVRSWERRALSLSWFQLGPRTSTVGAVPKSSQRLEAVKSLLSWNWGLRASLVPWQPPYLCLLMSHFWFFFQSFVFPRKVSLWSPGFPTVLHENYILRADNETGRDSAHNSLVGWLTGCSRFPPLGPSWYACIYTSASPWRKHLPGMKPQNRLVFCFPNSFISPVECSINHWPSSENKASKQTIK